MNGNNLQEALSLHDALCSSSTTVLETMFFSESAPINGASLHINPVACLLHSSGAVNRTFSIAIDRSALDLLCESFYGALPSATQPFELLCEFTNMIAGSTLSLCSPSHYCPLSSPQLCDVEAHLRLAALPDSITYSLAVDGGLISIACALRTT